MPVLTTAPSPPHRYAALEQQTGAVVGMLSDVDSDVRLAAMQLLAKLQTSAIVDYASVVVQRCADLVCALAACKCSPRRPILPQARGSGCGCATDGDARALEARAVQVGRARGGDGPEARVQDARALARRGVQIRISQIRLTHNARVLEAICAPGGGMVACGLEWRARGGCNCLAQPTCGCGGQVVRASP